MALNEVIEQMPKKKLRGALGKLSKRAAQLPSSDDPQVELRRLVRQHKAWTRKAVAIVAMSSDRKNRETDEVIKCDLPEDVRCQMHDVAKSLRREGARLKSAMVRCLRELPIWNLYLSRVFGVGPVIGAYLAADIDIHKAEKPSSLRMYCGMAVIDGRLVRRSRGQKNTFSSEMRTRLFQLFQAMWKNRSHCPKNKYLEIWDNVRHRFEHSERIVDKRVDAKGDWVGKIINGQGKTVSARGFAHSTGWHKAADVFLEDLYVVWRAIEGVPVWPSYYAAKLGYEHGGKISVKTPRMLTVDEALGLVGNVFGDTPEEHDVIDTMTDEVDSEVAV